MTNIPDIFGQYFGPVQDKLDKLPKEIAAEADIMLYERARTVKHMELPQILLGTAASNVLAIGEVSGIVLGPRQGYAWAVRRLVVDGLTSGSTPDVVNLYKHGFPSSDLAPTIPPAWQFNGNNFGYTFGKGELTLRNGMTLNLYGTAIAATGQIRLTGELVEVAEERLGIYLG